MITVATSQIDFYQKKIYRLEMEVITLQEQLMILKTTNPDEFKLKYQVLLEKIAQENQSRQARRAEELQAQEKNIIQTSQKWQILLSEKSIEFNSKIEALSLEKSSLRNKTIQLQLKIIKLQKQIDEGDAEILKIKLQTVKKENQRLRNQNEELYKGREQVIDDLKKEADSRVSQAIQREKTFYRDQIQNLQNHIIELEGSIVVEKQKTNPERQKVILQLQNQLHVKDQNHQKQLQKFTNILEQRNKQIISLRDIIQKKDKSNYDLLNDLTNQLKVLQAKDFNSKFQKQAQLKYLYSELSKKRQAEVDQLKEQMQKINQAFDLERKEWKKIIEQAQNGGQSLKRSLQQEKQRYLDQKKRLKTKIAELKIRLKEKQEDKGNGQTQMLIKSLREMNNAEQHFSSYENAITFMDRQVRKAMGKIDQKNREINGLLSQLKVVQAQSQKQLAETKEKFKNQQKKLYDRIFALEQQLDDSEQKLRAKQKEIKKIQSQFQSFDEAHKLQVQNLRKIIDQMQRDYKRVTNHKKSVEDSYREQRQNVITSKIDINTEKKNKWRELIKQKNQMEISYREREIKLKSEYQMAVDKLKRDRIKLIEEKEDYKAEAELLRQKLNEKGQENKQNKLIDYQKKLATLDLEIALTQNLFSTLSNFTNKKSQFAQLSEDHSSKIGSDHSFEIKVTGPVVTPPFNSAEYVNEEVYKEARFSFAPRIIK